MRGPNVHPFLPVRLGLERFMKLSYFSVALVLASIAFSNAQAADDKLFLQLATCQESWLDWKNIPPKMTPFQNRIATDLKAVEGTAGYTPLKPMSLLGFNVVEVYPGSVGMGLGFSVVVDAGFDNVKTSLEKQVGKRITECSFQENTRDCGYSFAEKKTLTLTEVTKGKNAKTLFGCYYYYEK